ncbi:GTP-binding protein obg [Gemella morbillorum]|uniref:GTPase ObgE n=1 Tax=Gemella morbillorum TaxID=29391 RepID=UPI000DA2B06F|nr:GTPase ObgE [Gemella morbillorum]MBF1209912.1 GTPase ObgE [Gemella morbillorum]MDK8239948.1 GTPase ObgE [Gemella morbillorum]MDK8255381.1 GTPase ObgE [Gemella morbillorum]UBH81255.1 GTPase ObgE [Gemella morbillorum]SQH55019.1 GTP-binding protein obg [Gemella morbillorum]
MFLDEVKIFVRSGDGGNGLVAFRREKYVPKGGPAGGDGGRGANVVFIVDEGLRTFMDYRYQKKFVAPNGENGMSKGMHGRKSKDLYLKVPPGTVIRDTDTGEVLADLVEHEQEVIVARGGRGGRGNCRFATPSNPAPEIAENGEPGEERNLTLELKLMADVGLVGFPSVGKSTLLSITSKAKPKIADYHFTTLAPNLGVVETKDHRSFVMADLPGLIEGASQGVGLGHQFLRHIERTKVIVHVVDMSATDGRDPYEDYKIINQELGEYNMRLLERPQIVVANKMDIPAAQENLEEFKAKLAADGEEVDIVEISAFTRTNVDNLLYKISDILDSTDPNMLYELDTEEESMENRVLYKHKPKDETFKITRDDTAAYVVSGPGIERAFLMTDFNRDASVRRFAQQMRSMGVDDALRERGCKNGDTVKILKGEFEFVE